MSELPKGWAKTTLDQVADWSSGGTPSRSNISFYSGNIPWVKTGELGSKYIYTAEEKITEDAVKKSSAKVFKKGSVALAMYGATIGKSSILKVDASTNQACAVGFPLATNSEFLYYFILSQNQKFIDAGKGGAQPNISQTIIKSWEIILPPLNEQVRIVTKLEELLSDLDAGVSELKTAQAKLIQYRQSLLKAAVEGELTREWRESQLANTAHETGAQLLARILQERRKRWEDKQLAKFAEQGKQPPKDWQKKYPEPVQPDTTDLPALPEGWVWATVDQISEIQGGIQKKPSRAPVKNKYPFLRVANVYRAQLRLDDIHEIELLDGELERLALIRGDILIVEGNGSLSEIGRCAVWDGSIENAVHQNHLIRSRPVLMRSDFVETWLNSFRGIEYMTKLAATTSGLYTLSVGKISKIPLPIPSLVEQTKILELLQEALDQEKNQSTAIEQSLKQSAAQRKNILRAAFAGELVPQDPNDEPASVLLERIQAERAAQTAAKKPRGQKNTPNKNGVCHEN